VRRGKRAASGPTASPSVAVTPPPLPARPATKTTPGQRRRRRRRTTNSPHTSLDNSLLLQSCRSASRCRPVPATEPRRRTFGDAILPAIQDEPRSAIRSRYEDGPDRARLQNRSADRIRAAAGDDVSRLLGEVVGAEAVGTLELSLNLCAAIRRALTSRFAAASPTATDRDPASPNPMTALTPAHRAANITTPTMTPREPVASHWRNGGPRRAGVRQ
jgi:hypothetical protein